MIDVRRREPRNVGIVLFTDSGVHAKFRGEEAGTIDGRRVRDLGSLENYRAWVRRWRRDAAKNDPVRMVSATPHQNYFLEFGGARLLGNAGLNPETFVAELFRELVDESPAPDMAEKAEIVERTFERLHISNKITKAPRITIERDGVRDQLAFDYEYRNGIYALMKQVTVTRDAWDPIHAAAYSFEQARLEDRDCKLISLVTFSPASTADSKESVNILRRHASVVDFTDEIRAERELGTALALSV